MQGVTRQTGIISDIDEAVVRVRVTLPECDDLKSNWLPVLQRNTQDNKDYWLPDIGEQVEVLLDDNGEDGVVLGAVYSTVDTAPLAPRDKRYVQFSDGAHLNTIASYTSSRSTAVSKKSSSRYRIAPASHHHVWRLKHNR